MTKYVIALAALAAAISTAAVVTEKKPSVPSTATQMNDSEMDKVTAAGGNPDPFTLILPNDPKLMVNPGGYSNICINVLNACR
jgi:hypothetical protein